MTTTLILAGLAPTALSAAGWWRAQRAAARLRARLHIDALTGLANEDGLAAALAAARWTGPQVGLLLLDLDGFKQVNDTYGHPEGNTVLRHVAAQLAAVAGLGEVAARLHGDEFALLLGPLPAGAAGQDRAEARAAAVRAAVAEPLVTELTCHSMSASVGAAMLPEHRAELSRLLVAADRAMYAVKNPGRPMPAAAVAGRRYRR